MRVRKTDLVSPSLLMALTFLAQQDSVPARQLTPNSQCPPITEDERRRRYPPLQHQPRTVYVVGSVSAPGPVERRDGLTLRQAVAAAGGVLADADVTKVRLMSISEKEPERSARVFDIRLMAERSDDVALADGDIIEVLSKCGAVIAPSMPKYDPVPLKNPSHVE